MELENQKEVKIENKEITTQTINNNEKEEEKIDYKNYPLEEEDELNKDDINDIVDYLKDLDYEKYAHDMEIREALELLKSKMLKDEEEKKKNETKITTIEDNNNKNKNISNEKIEEEKEKKVEEKKEEKIEEIKPQIPKETKPIIDTEKEKKKDEIRKYRVAESIAKTDKMKAVHSIQSVRKLIQSQGLDGNIDPLRITVIKENPLTRDDEYVPNKLPFLHSLPLV